jgi:hypothetical protein
MDDKWFVVGGMTMPTSAALGDPVAALRRIRAVVDHVRRASAPGAVAGEVAVEAEGADVVAALTELREVRDHIAGWEPELVAAARERGISWADLAPALGVGSRQAAERRFLRLQPSSSGEETGEARVRAERNRRAGDRAVASWARRNAVPLRRLAAQVLSTGEPRSPAGRRRTERVHRALADDDPASLLGPLAAACDDLGEQHVGLAEQIRAVTETGAQVRRYAMRGEPQ